MSITTQWLIRGAREPGTLATPMHSIPAGVPSEVCPPQPSTLGRHVF